MQYRVLMHLDIDTRNIEEAGEHAKKLLKLIKDPLVLMSIESEGIRLVGGDGRPTVYNPQPVINGQGTATAPRR